MRTELIRPGDNDQPGYHFPGFIPAIWKNRTLAMYDGLQIITEHGTSSTPQSFYEFCTAVFTDDLLTFVESILDFSWLDQAIETGGIVFCTPKGIPTALQLHGKKNKHHCTRWLIQSSAWQQFKPTERLLTRLRMLFDYCGVGTANTPGALGMQLQKRALYETYGDQVVFHRHPLPPYRCVEDLRAMSTGARSDLLVETTQIFDTVYELDMKIGYGAAFVEQPSGPSIPHRGQFLEQYATYVSHCTIDILDPLPLGCFPVRTQVGKETRIEYPREVGRYQTFLWKEEIDKALQMGCGALRGPGWGWLSMTRDNARFVEMMTELRDNAPEPIVDWLKLAIVAGIGRHGCSWESSFLVPEGEQSEGDIEAAWHGLVYEFYVHSAMLRVPESMQHWFSYTLMKCRMFLFEAALPFARLGQLLATDTDGIYVSEDAEVEAFIEKHKAYGTRAGTWRKTTLSHVQFPALRHLISNEKIKQPGVPKE